MVVGPEIVSNVFNEAIFDAIDTTIYTDRIEHPWKVYLPCVHYLHPRFARPSKVSRENCIMCKLQSFASIS